MAQRRIVTGHDSEGRSVVLEDGPVPVSNELPEGSRFDEVWISAETPVRLSPREPEPTHPDAEIPPPAHGSLVRVIETPAGVKVPLHRTESIDYGIVLDGEMTLILDSGEEVTLRRGDVVVQRGTEHAWENRGTGPVTMFIASVDGEFTPDLEGAFAAEASRSATPSTGTFDVDAIRARFSSLRDGFAFLDAPGGSQVPDEVGAAVAASFIDASGNLGAPYATGERVEEILFGAKADAARFLGGDGDNIVFGPNMTSVNFALSRSAGRDLGPGDEVLITRLDHDGSAAPWVELAADRGFEVKLVDTTEDFRLDYEDLERKLSDRTRIVAFPWASNVFGTRVDAARVCALAHEAGALAWVDAVHYAAHEPVDVAAIGADVLLCSAYKFCGPHLGMAHVRPEVAQDWRPYKARPSASNPFGRRFETGTPTYELLAGLSATFAYIDSIGGIGATVAPERALAERFVAELPDGVEIYGPPLEDRLPTFLLNVEGVPAATVAREMAKRDIGVWHHDHYYALGVADRLPYPEEAIRAGFIHYNTTAEVDRFIAALGELAAGS